VVDEEAGGQQLSTMMKLR